MKKLPVAPQLGTPLVYNKVQSSSSGIEQVYEPEKVLSQGELDEWKHQ